jgi:hypothetical protein
MMSDTKATQNQNQNVQLTQEQLFALLTEVKKPYVDPAKAAQKESIKKALRAEFELGKERTAFQQKHCSHMHKNGASSMCRVMRGNETHYFICVHCEKQAFRDGSDEDRALFLHHDQIVER